MTAPQLIKVHDIHGGVHPPENKQQSLKTPIKPAPIPEELILPFSQHIGAPSRPVVQVGDHVLKGQMIAEPAGFVSVPVHAPTSGTITAIEDRVIPHPSGMSAPCIVLRCDGKDEWTEHHGVEDYKQLDKAELINIIRNAGIAGMGGAGFPSAVKLNTQPNQVIDTLIINGTECEPYITADAILMRERADAIINGTQILQHIINPTERILIGVEDNKPEGIKALKQAAEGTGIDIVVFPTKYPSGGEKQLIQILTGREVPAGGLPAEIGIVCQNIGSAVAIHRAITQGEPLISRITTVTGDAVQQQQNYEVLLGTPISTLLEASGFQPQKEQRLIMGGPMMGFALTSQAVPVVKTTNCILAPTKKEMPPPPPAQACIRCGMCSEVCPATLLPQQMYWYARAKDHDALEEHNLFDCIECGACSYVCPSNIPLVQYYRASKADIRKAEAEQKKAEYSKQRFEARQARLEKMEAEKEAKRRERQQRAAAGSQKTEQKAEKPAPAASSDDPVQAAIERAKAKADNPKAPAAASDDPVQAAIERAKAKRTGADAGNEDPRAKLEKDIASLEKRLNASRDKLNQAEAEESATVDALKAACEKLESKLQKAKEELGALGNKPAEDKPAPAAADDPVQAAIERAKAKRAGTGTDEDPKAKLEKDIASLEKRLAASREKHAQAEADGADTADALKAGCEKMQAKLQKARDELAALGEHKPAEEKTEEPPAPSDDPVQAAIERAKAKRAGKVNEDPKAKLDKEIASLERRIANIEQKLGPEEGSDKEDALKVSLGKMQQKLADAKAQREQLG